MENEIANEILKQVKNLGNELNEFRKETNERFDSLETRVGSLETKVDNLEGKFDELEKITKENTNAIKTLEKVAEENTNAIKTLEKVAEENTNAIKTLGKATEENTNAIKTLEKATEENTKSIKTLEKVTEDNTLEIIKLKAKMDDFGEQRKKDRLELIDVLQRMDKSISKRFDEVDAHFERIYAVQAFNDVEHAEYRQAIKVLKMKDNIFAKKLEELEEWKKDFDSGLFAV